MKLNLILLMPAARLTMVAPSTRAGDVDPKAKAGLGWTKDQLDEQYKDASQWERPAGVFHYQKNEEDGLLVFVTFTDNKA